MTEPGSNDPYGYFANGPSAAAPLPAASSVQPVPTAHPGTFGPAAGYLDPQERDMLAGARLTAEHNMGATASYQPVGSRLGFMGGISAGFRLLPTCWTALTAEPVLLVVPILVLFVGLLATGGYALAFGGFAHLVFGGRAAVAVKTLPLTIVLCVVSVIGRAVVVADATQRLQGSKPRIDQAWSLTLSRLPALIGFGVAQAVERTVTSSLRNGALGRVTADVADRAWDFATFLAVPAILFDRIGPVAAVRRSGALVASRWGTQLTARAVLSCAVGACAVPLLVLGVVIAAVNAPLGIAVIVVVAVAAISISSALTGILSAAMYRFATTGLLAPGFAESDMWSVFARR
jgi:hypothetical protein